MTATQELIIQYIPRGVAHEVFALRDPELLLCGPAGTGKSLACLYKIHLAALKYPGARILMVRKTRRSLTESAMVTYWQKIRPDLDGVAWKPSFQQYQYPNGSIIAVGGMDRPSKIMSSEWDIIYVQEAPELDEVDWESCTVRLRNGKMPYQQLLADANPDSPQHWLKLRADAGRTVMLESRHEDNPLLFDIQGNMTTEGQRYLSVLENLTGVRLLRLRYGLWSSSENMVYQDVWDRKRILIDRTIIPPEWPRYLSIDFGFTHPFVCLWGAIDPDGRIWIYREIHKTKTLVEDHAKIIKQVSRWGQPGGDPFPRAIICDHDAEDRATLERHLGLNTIPAQKNVSAGIQAVASRFKDAGDGKPRIYIMRDSLVQRDPMLVDAKQPTCLEEEPEGYIWQTDSSGKKDQPVKENDDSLDCLRYLTAYFDLRPSEVRYSGRVY
jgi:phage terminase large subunit